MYAVIETGGKQYRVEPGDVLDVELLGADSKKKVSFDRVLLVGAEDGTRVGTPTVSGARVTATLVDQVRGPKLRIFKMKRRKGFRSRTGHRQDRQRIRIEKIEA